MPANLVRVATGQACRVVPAPGRVKPGARIVRSCCLVCVAQLLPVAAWAVGRAAWFAVIRCQVTAALAVIRWSVTAALAVIRCRPLPGPRCLDLVPVAAERCLVAAGRPGRAAAAGGCLVAQLLPGRVCVCVAGRSVFVIRWPGSQTPGPRCLVRDPWPACLAAWSVAHGPRGLQRK